MYLMNVPPVAATQTEWRTCGPPGGYSLPICFNDSDPELSTRGTPISDKVQMIIESLRSTQSSLEMGDEMEGNVLVGQEGHPQACKVAVGSYVGAKSKTQCPTENQRADTSSPMNHESNDSDSDDSVDRGIEEAILEYLKEKDGHKRKAEPCFKILESSKIPRKDPPVHEASKQNSDSNTFLIANNQFPRSVKAEAPTTPAGIPIKKYIKQKASLEENAVKEFDAPTKSLVLPKEQTQSPCKTISHINKVKCPVNYYLEDESNDSSSDDGIEEAIQRYQIEKKEQQNKREAFLPNEFSEESDSTSDDGIEEAIRCYQLEQLKEKSVLKPFLGKPKSFIHAVGGTSTDNVKKSKLLKKKTRAEKEAKAAQPPSSVSVPKNTLSENLKAKGNGLLFVKMESSNEQVAPTSAPPKANTTAELMCAEAILDISKTVMPGPFHHNVGLSSYAPSESSLQSSLADNGREEESDGSSIDSEDGIEQEIRKFLEQKAQMHQQPADSGKTREAPNINQPEEAKAKSVATPKKSHRLSLTQRRKNRDKTLSNAPTMENKVKETQPSPEHRKESSQRSQTHVAGLREKEQSGDKSSSLDSDEDLDTAIKDLLKTKKKSKKKTRDLKLKSKFLKAEEHVLGNASQPKKFKQNPTSKRSALKKMLRCKNDMKDKSGLSKKTVLQHKQADKSKEHDAHNVETANLKATPSQDILLLHTETAHQIKEDSSAVDSDDSIEQEIRRFLAEKAKVSTAEKGKAEGVLKTATDVACNTIHVKYIKQENQLAEIPINSPGPFSGRSPLSSQPVPVSQSSDPDSSSVGVQLRMSAVLPCSPSLLEPADGAGGGAGVARTELNWPSTGRNDINEVTPATERARQVMSPSAAHSRSESIKWRQSFGLPTDAKTLSQFQITTSRLNDTSSATTPNQSGVTNPKSQTPVTVWSSAKTGRGHFPSAPETTVNTNCRSTVLNLSSLARQHPRMSFARSLAPDHRSQCPLEGEIKSMVHISKDKSVFVELESNRTNHVQVRSRERSVGTERVDLLSEIKREEESVKIDDKEVKLERREDEFVDEAACESDNRRNLEKKQGFTTLSLSSAIDPGITFRPCIALTTEERSRMFNRRYHTDKSKKGVPPHDSGPGQNKVQRVKRKLQFIQVNRENEAPGNSRKHAHAV